MLNSIWDAIVSMFLMCLVIFIIFGLITSFIIIGAVIATIVGFIGVLFLVWFTGSAIYEMHLKGKW